MKQSDLTKLLQIALIAEGEKLTVDGDLGSRTSDAAEKYKVVIKLEPARAAVAEPRAVLPKSSYFGAPWVGANLDLLGMHESNSALNARYVPEWKLEGLDYKTLVGNRHAWCSVRENADKRKVGVKGTNSAAASSWSPYGRQCPFWFGATLPIKHKSGGRHVATFLYWIDEKKKICATLDGNRGNKFQVCQTDLSGRGDTLVGGPRWPKNWDDGQFITMKEVLAVYPNLKVGAMGSASTT